MQVFQARLCRSLDKAILTLRLGIVKVTVKDIQMNTATARKYLLGTICWTARAIGVFVAGVVVALVVAHAFSDEGLPNPLNQPWDVRLEFLGLFSAVLGVILAWKWELLGGLLIIGGMMVFHVIEKQIWLGYGELFDLAGVLFLAHWYLKRLKSN